MSNSLIGIVNYEINSSSSNGGNIQHSSLQGLSYSESGHTGFQPQTDNNLKTNNKTTTGAINEIFDLTQKSLLPKTITGGNPSTKGTFIIDGGNPTSIPKYTINGGDPTVQLGNVI